MVGTNNCGNLFSFWCQKVLPTVYDDSLSYYELLCKVVNHLSEVVKGVDNVTEELKKLKEYVDTYFENIDVESVIVEEFNKLVEQGAIGNLLFGYHTYKEFGAVMDGVTNDYDAVKRCHEQANIDGLPVVNFGGEIYINGSEQIEVKTDTIFHGTVVYLGDYNLCQFKTSHDNSVVRSNIFIRDVFTDEHTVSDEYKNKFFVIRTNESIGNRLNTTNVSYLTIPCQSVENYCEFPLPNFEQAKDWVCDIESICDIFEKGIVFGGCTVRTKSGLTTPMLLEVARNNCVVENIYSDFRSVSSLSYGCVLTARYACNCTFRNITTNTESNDTYAYTINILNASNVVVDELNGKSFPASLASNTINGIKLVNSNCYRFDCHNNMFGLNVIDSCNIVAGYLGFGYGTTRFLNSTCDVRYRDDYCLAYMGDVYITNCTGREYIYMDNRYSFEPTIAKSDNIQIRNSRISIDSCDNAVIYEGHHLTDILPACTICVNNTNVSVEYSSDHLNTDKYLFNKCVVTAGGGIRYGKFIHCDVTITGLRDIQYVHAFYNSLIKYSGYNNDKLRIYAVDSFIQLMTDGRNIYSAKLINCNGIMIGNANNLQIDGGYFTGYKGHTIMPVSGYINNCVFTTDGGYNYCVTTLNTLTKTNVVGPGEYYTNRALGTNTAIVNIDYTLATNIF